LKIKFDSDVFRQGKSDFIAHIKRKEVVNDWEKLEPEISIYCACHSFPLFAAYTFIGEEFGFSVNIEKKLISLKEFYGYE
jgi:hypothetical protein